VNSSSQDPKRRRSEDYARGLFRPHGRIEIWSEGSVVRLVAEGPFNLEILQGLGVAMSELFAESPPQGRFADILEMRSSILASPEVMSAFGDFLARMSAAKTAPVAVAYIVGPEVEGRELMLPLFSRIYAQHQRRFAAFETEAEALDWVRHQLAEA
jgi:hypothetical protein